MSTYIRVRGRLDAASAPALAEELTGALRFHLDGAAVPYVVDLSGVEDVEPAGERALVRFVEECRDLAIDLRVVLGGHPWLTRVLPRTPAPPAPASSAPVRDLQL